MKTNVKEIIWVNSPSFVIGDSRVVILEPISVELNNSLNELLKVALSVRNGDKPATLLYFVNHLAVCLLLPIRVLPALHF